jgi:hypothetical protein
MNLTQDIQNLLYTEPCVIIPGFGGFVSNPKPSEIDTVSKTVKPITNQLAFNAALQTNDGVLANYIKNRCNISFNEALQHIDNFVTQLKDNLNEKRNADIQGIGSFYLNKDNQLLFVPYHSIGFNKVSYGLPILRLKEKISTNTPILDAKTTTQEQSIKIQPLTDKDKQRKISQTKSQRTKNEKTIMTSKNVLIKVLNIIGIIVILFVFGAIVFNEVKPIKSESLNLASFVDTPNSENDESLEKRANLKELIHRYSDKSKHSYFKIQLASTYSRTEAEEIKNELKSKFNNIQIKPLNNKDFQITLIEFENEKFVNDYLKLVQPRIEYPLTINK